VLCRTGALLGYKPFTYSETQVFEVSGLERLLWLGCAPSVHTRIGSPPKSP
jgi:hypothetical protein